MSHRCQCSPQKRAKAFRRARFLSSASQRLSRIKSSLIGPTLEIFFHDPLLPFPLSCTYAGDFLRHLGSLSPQLQIEFSREKAAGLLSILELGPKRLTANDYSSRSMSQYYTRRCLVHFLATRAAAFHKGLLEVGFVELDASTFQYRLPLPQSLQRLLVAVHACCVPRPWYRCPHAGSVQLRQRGLVNIRLGRQCPGALHEQRLADRAERCRSA
jgi:hypothetical protein